ncbi:MAG: protein jag [Clostridia bacterium]|nr:protein jag [Clostridia bacterium]
MEFKAKTVEEAVALGLSELNLTEETANVTIIEQPVKGLFGRLKGQAVVEITPKQIEKQEQQNDVDGEQKAAQLVEKVLSFMGIQATTEISHADGRTIITLNSEETSSLIGYRGEVLDALQTLAGAMANAGKKEYGKVVVDCENYRDRREETLIKLAKRLEQKATEIRREVILEPMSPFERRIIHTALADSQTVTTTSNGKEPNRYVVIVPNDKDEYSRPYNAGRNNERSSRRGGKRDNRRDNRRDGNRGERTGANRRVSPSKKPTKISFGTYLGNSLKDKE